MRPRSFREPTWPPPDGVAAKALGLRAHRVQAPYVNGMRPAKSPKIYTVRNHVRRLPR